MEEIDDTEIYEVEKIIGARRVKSKFEYLIKWRGWDATTNTWEPVMHIDPALIDAYHGRPHQGRRQLAPRRGKGCARARLSAADQRRGIVPHTISMVCGSVKAKLTVSRTDAYMPRASLQFFVLSMDKNGHIIWPTSFDAHTRAALRMQARAHLRAMIDDPKNPCDSTMEPAMTGTGTSAIWQGAPKRKLVEVVVQQQ